MKDGTWYISVHTNLRPILNVWLQRKAATHILELDTLFKLAHRLLIILSNTKTAEFIPSSGKKKTLHDATRLIAKQRDGNDREQFFLLVDLLRWSNLLEKLNVDQNQQKMVKFHNNSATNNWISSWKKTRIYKFSPFKQQNSTILYFWSVFSFNNLTKSTVYKKFHNSSKTNNLLSYLLFPLLYNHSPIIYFSILIIILFSFASFMALFCYWLIAIVMFFFFFHLLLKITLFELRVFQKQLSTFAK